jgi:hypothetical protein
MLDNDEPVPLLDSEFKKKSVKKVVEPTTPVRRNRDPGPVVQQTPVRRTQVPPAQQTPVRRNQGPTIQQTPVSRRIHSAAHADMVNDIRHLR